MRQKLKTYWVIFFVFTILLSACGNPKTNESGYPPPENDTNSQVPSPTEIAINNYPAPIMTEELPTPGYPASINTIPTVEISLDNSKVITSDNINQLKLTNSLNVDEMVRVMWSIDQKTVSIIGYDHFYIYSFPELNKLFEYSNKPNEYLVDISPDGVSYATTANDGFLVINNWKTGEIRTIETGTLFMSGEFSPDGSEIMIAHLDEWAASIFNVYSGELMTTISGFETAAPIYNVRFSNDGRKAVWTARATIQLSDITSNKIAPAIYHQDFISSYTTSTDGSLLITSASKTVNDSFVPLVFFYNASTGDLINTFELSIPAYTMSISSESPLLAVNESDSVVIINTQTCNEVYRFAVHPENINQIVFSPLGDVLATTGSDQQVKFWSIP